MSTTGEQIVHYCNRYGVFCTGANERGECNTTGCWNNSFQSQTVYIGSPLVSGKGPWSYVTVYTDNPMIEYSPIRHGRWLEYGENKDGSHNIKCSKCGEGFKSKGHARSYYTKHKYRYCPNCGAKMERF